MITICFQRRLKVYTSSEFLETRIALSKLKRLMGFYLAVNNTQRFIPYLNIVFEIIIQLFVVVLQMINKTDAGTKAD